MSAVVHFTFVLYCNKKWWHIAVWRQSKYQLLPCLCLRTNQFPSLVLNFLLFHLASEFWSEDWKLRIQTRDIVLACCMSLEYFSDNFYGGYCEVVNPLQWPQLRKKRRTGTTPLLLLLLLLLHHPLLRFCRTGVLLLPSRIPSPRQLPWRPWSDLLRPSPILLLLRLLPAKVF